MLAMRDFLASVPADPIVLTDTEPVADTDWWRQDGPTQCWTDSRDLGTHTKCVAISAVRPLACAFRHNGAICEGPGAATVWASYSPAPCVALHWAHKVPHAEAEAVLGRLGTAFNVVLTWGAGENVLPCVFHRAFPWVAFDMDRMQHMWIAALSHELGFEQQPVRANSVATYKMASRALFALVKPAVVEDTPDLKDGLGPSGVHYPWGSGQSACSRGSCEERASSVFTGATSGACVSTVAHSEPTETKPAADPDSALLPAQVEPVQSEPTAGDAFSAPTIVPDACVPPPGLEGEVVDEPKPDSDRRKHKKDKKEKKEKKTKIERREERKLEPSQPHAVEPVEAEAFIRSAWPGTESARMCAVAVDLHRSLVLSGEAHLPGYTRVEPGTDPFDGVNMDVDEPAPDITTNSVCVGGGRVLGESCSFPGYEVPPIPRGSIVAGPGDVVVARSFHSDLRGYVQPFTESSAEAPDRLPFVSAVNAGHLECALLEAAPGPKPHFGHIIISGLERHETLREHAALRSLWAARPGIQSQLCSDAYMKYLFEDGFEQRPLLSQTKRRKLIDRNLQHGLESEYSATAVVIPVFRIPENQFAARLNYRFAAAALSLWHNGVTHLTITVVSRGARTRTEIGVGHLLAGNSTLDLFGSTWLCLCDGRDETGVGHLALPSDLAEDLGPVRQRNTTGGLSRAESYLPFVWAVKALRAKALEQAHVARPEVDAAAPAAAAPDTDSRQVRAKGKGQPKRASRF